MTDRLHRPKVASRDPRSKNKQLHFCVAVTRCLVPSARLQRLRYTSPQSHMRKTRFASEPRMTTAEACLILCTLDKAFAGVIYTRRQWSEPSERHLMLSMGLLLAALCFKRKVRNLTSHGSLACLIITRVMLGQTSYNS
jgi:hypothetical protein